MKTLIIDDKFTIEYNDEDNDRPVEVLRYGESHDLFVHKPNWVRALFYELLTTRQQLNEARNAESRLRFPDTTGQ